MAGIEEATRQADWIVPPLKNAQWVIAVTAASAATDITALAAKNTYYTMQADGGAIYVAFDAATLTVDNTAVGTPATGGCIKIPQDGSINVKLTQGLHAFIAAKTAAGNATLRIWQSGPARPT